MSHNGPDSKSRAFGTDDDGHANVVDHHAAHGMSFSRKSIRVYLIQDLAVTDDAAAQRRNGRDGIVTVQPLRQSEMQVGATLASFVFSTHVVSSLLTPKIMALQRLLTECMDPSYKPWAHAWVSSVLFPAAPSQIPSETSNKVRIHPRLSSTRRKVTNIFHVGSVGLVSRFGQFYKSVDPGLTYVNVCTESLRVVDVKIQISAIGRQTVITRDNVNVEIDSVIYFQIVNPYRAAFGISDLRQALVERAQTTLRHVVGARAVQSVVTEREAIAFEIAEIVGDVADKWGVAIEGILIKDIIFSPEVAASLSSAAQQKRIGESKVIAARAEVDAARLMRQAADILASPAAMQIRQLEALQQMAKSSASKVIFVPMQLQSDIVGQLGNASGSNLGAIAQSESQDDSGIGAAGRAGLLNSMAQV
ncbi:hypothetical protein H0H93_008894 [Arthromyces matolae]|nr:hypothetical protein H0H93_008894 [Arthromyces matolae]